MVKYDDCCRLQRKFITCAIGPNLMIVAVGVAAVNSFDRGEFEEDCFWLDVGIAGLVR